MAEFNTWVTVQRMEADLRDRAIARRARLGPLPERQSGWSALVARVVRLWQRLVRRPVRLEAAPAAPRTRTVCQHRALAVRRPCRVCGASARGAAAFRPGYRPRRCSRHIARGKTRI